MWFPGRQWSVPLPLRLTSVPPQDRQPAEMASSVFSLEEDSDISEDEAEDSAGLSVVGSDRKTLPPFWPNSSASSHVTFLAGVKAVTEDAPSRPSKGKISAVYVTELRDIVEISPLFGRCGSSSTLHCFRNLAHWSSPSLTRHPFQPVGLPGQTAGHEFPLGVSLSSAHLDWTPRLPFADSTPHRRRRIN